jgi:hypothetical protein
VLPPLHTVAAPTVAVPPTEVGLTVTVATEELAEAHMPLVTVARYHIFCVRLPVLNVVEVAPLTLLYVLPSVDEYHWIVPVLPASVIVVPLPLHTVEAVAVAVPPTEAASTVTLFVVELAAEHTPLVTTAR